MNDKFKKLKKLGSGHFGEVWLVNDVHLGETKALKLIDKNKIVNTKQLFREAQILNKLRHENIVEIKEAGWYENNKTIYIAMEYLPKGSLGDQIKGKSIPLTRAINLLIDILKGLEKAHESGILHRDIKPNNILLSNANKGKLSDFGLSVPIGIDFQKEEINDYWYPLHKPPEIFLKKNYDIRSEIYSCGVTLYRLVNGDNNLRPLPDDWKNRILNGKLPNRSDYKHFIPRGLKTLINKALNVIPSKRYQSAEKMCRALEQLNIYQNWNEKEYPNGRVEWIATGNNFTYVVNCFPDKKNRWCVTFKKGPNKSTVRKISKLCLTGLSKREALSKASKILQKIVTGFQPLEITI